MVAEDDVVLHPGIDQVAPRTADQDIQSGTRRDPVGAARIRGGRLDALEIARV